MSNKVHERKYYSLSDVTGAGSVLVTLRFGKILKYGPIITKKTTLEKDVEIQHDIDRFIKEVNEGVKKANKEFNTFLEVEEIQIIPDDYPQEGQVLRASYLIAKDYIKRIKIDE